MAGHAIRNPLFLPELFHHILDYIYVSNPVETGKEHRIRVHEPSRAARKALFALAQTCRAISEPSLDRLWRALGSLEPLIRCFAQVADVDRAKMPPSPTEWAVIRRYAVRVRELRITESMLDLSFVKCISSQPLWLLPNLRVLIWVPDPIYAGFTPPIEQLLVPGLVSLDISLKRVEDSLHRLFERYAVLCPNLKALGWDFGLSVYGNRPVLDAMDTLSDSVLRLRKVENLRLFAPLDAITLQHAILSLNYKVLGIMLDPPFGKEQIDVTPADTPFPNVETIELVIWDLDFLTSLLRPRQQMFHTLIFRLHYDGAQPVVQSMLSCFTALATPQRIGSLQLIYIYLDHRLADAEVQVLENAPMSYCITYETLSPLASFRCLRKLVVILHNQISIDDDELATLARSWPSLEVLHLDCRSGGWPWASAKYVTLRGLLALIAACPELYQLCLPIDARIVPMDVSPDICNTAIKYIQLPDSLISEPRWVADFFEKHLPCVESVDEERREFRGGDVAYMEECRRMWEEVDELLWCR